MRLQHWFYWQEYISECNDYKQMISEQDIKNWWECKIANYLQNYAKKNRLTIAHAKEKFFTETHEKFVELVPQILKKLMDEKSRSN